MHPLVVKNATKLYHVGDHAVAALNGISIDVAQGSFLAIMGASGSGKSTLLHLMSGLTTPDSGHVVVNGTDLSSMNDRQLTAFRRQHIGLVFQSFNLMPTMSAIDNVALPLVLEGTKIKGKVLEKIHDIFARLGLSHRMTHKPDALSGGEQQRVAIGRALVNDPAVILADEPTGSLDSANSKIVCELLRDLAAIHGKTIVMVTHEPSVAAYAQEVAIIRDGQLLDRFATEGVDSHSGLANRYLKLVGGG
jgi:putative ABC transport system ATP-binding protein